MGFEQNTYRRIREEYETKYLRAREDADRRRREVELAVPALVAIHQRLSALGPEVMRITLQVADAQQREREMSALRERNEALLAEKAALLCAAGYPADYDTLRYECADCSDTGFLDSGEMCHCMRDQLIAASYRASGLGSLLGTQTFDNYSLDYFKSDEKAYRTMSTVVHTLRHYAEHFSTDPATTLPAGGNLLMVGGTGLGKTHLSTALARRVIERGFDVYYTTAQQMFFDFEHARFGTETGMERSADLARYSECELLILDDLGTEVSNQFTNSCLYMVLNNRINLGRATVINTNLSGRELKERYADRIASRILGDFKPLVFAGTDIRRQKLSGKV